MTKIRIRYRSVVEEIVTLPDEYDDDIRILETESEEDDVERSVERLYSFVDTQLPANAELYGIYNEEYTIAYCEV